MNKTGVIMCITGMHRSGTSLVSSWLASCGLNLHDGHVLGADLGNPRGHFEDQDFLDLHKSVIQQKVPRAEGWKICPETGLTFDNAHLLRAQQLVAERSEKFSHWGWKDPRTTIFLDQWKVMIPSLKALFIWRPASDCLDSLARRARRVTHMPHLKIDETFAFTMWKGYNQKLRDYKEKYPEDTLFFSLDFVIRNSGKVRELINSRFGMDLQNHPFEAVYDESLLKQAGALRQYVRF